MRSAVTLCHVPEAAAGPFVFHGPCEHGFEQAAAFGFDAVELFLPGPAAMEIAAIKALQQKHGLDIAAVGSGAGMVKHGLTFTDPDEDTRAKARTFLASMVEFGGQLGAPAILGSMQGNSGGTVSHPQAIDWLAEAVRDAGESAAKHGVAFIYEPLNRYECNLFNRQGAAAEWIDEQGLENVVILADLFHMSIEEPDLADALREAGRHVGHVHFADSNRQAMGFGHTDPGPVVAALREIQYSGYLSAEVFPLPDSNEAASQTIRSIKSALDPS